MRIQTFIDRLAEIAKVHPDANVQFKWAEDLGNGSSERDGDLVEIRDPAKSGGACSIVMAHPGSVERLRVYIANGKAQDQRR